MKTNKTTPIFGYTTFLFVEICRAKGLIGSEEELDLAWEKACVYHKDFENSDFNKSNKGLYECIVDFVDNI